MKNFKTLWQLKGKTWKKKLCILLPLAAFFFILFEQRDPNFHFALGPTDYVVPSTFPCLDF